MEARVNELVREGHLLISARRIAELESIAAGATRVAEQAVFAAINVLIGDNLWYDPSLWRHLQELQGFSAAFELDKTMNHSRNAAQVCGPDLSERSHKDRIRETTTVHTRSWHSDSGEMQQSSEVGCDDTHRLDQISCLELLSPTLRSALLTLNALLAKKLASCFDIKSESHIKDIVLS